MNWLYKVRSHDSRFSNLYWFLKNEGYGAPFVVWLFVVLLLAGAVYFGVLL